MVNQTPTRSKRRKEDEFLVTQLPTDVLTEILSYLPAREAYRLGTMAKSFQNLWKDVTNVIFEVKSDVAADQEIKFCNFFLAGLNNSGHKRRFSLVFEGKAEGFYPHIDRWVRWAVDNQIKILDFGRYYSDSLFCPTPPCLFTSDSLRELRLVNCSIHTGDLNVHLPLLESLRLEHVRIQRLKFNTLIDACPSLKKLTIIDCRFVGFDLPSLFTVHSESLKYLKLGTSILLLEQEYWTVRFVLPALQRSSLSATLRSNVVEPFTPTKDLEPGCFIVILDWKGLNLSLMMAERAFIDCVLPSDCVANKFTGLYLTLSNLQALSMKFRDGDMNQLILSHLRAECHDLVSNESLRECLMKMVNLKILCIYIEDTCKKGNKNKEIAALRRLKSKIVETLTTRLPNVEDVIIFVTLNGFHSFKSKSELKEMILKSLKKSCPKVSVEVSFVSSFSHET